MTNETQFHYHNDKEIRLSRDRNFTELSPRQILNAVIRRKFSIVMKQKYSKSTVFSSVSDLHSFCTYPDPAQNLNVDPDPRCQSNADPASSLPITKFL